MSTNSHPCETGKYPGSPFTRRYPKTADGQGLVTGRQERKVLFQFSHETPSCSCNQVVYTSVYNSNTLIGRVQLSRDRYHGFETHPPPSWGTRSGVHHGCIKITALSRAVSGLLVWKHIRGNMNKKKNFTWIGKKEKLWHWSHTSET